MKALIQAGQPANPVVLAVDDEVEILQSLADLLRKEFRVLATSSPEQALQFLEQQPVAVLVADQRMPQMQGTELLARAEELFPDTVRVLLTGYADIDAVVQAINDCHAFHYATKPWNGEKFLALMQKSAAVNRMAKERRRLVQELERLNQEIFLASETILSLENQGMELVSTNQTLEQALANLQNSFWHLRKIQEVLPICLGCSKVKTVDSNWQELVDFMKQNTSFLSHGYCPECFEKLRARLDLGKTKSEVP